MRLRQVTEVAADQDLEVRKLTEQLREVETSYKVVSQCRIKIEEKYAKTKVISLI